LYRCPIRHRSSIECAVFLSVRQSLGSVASEIEEYLKGRRVENFTASIATAGQNGWGCPNPNELLYCADDALRYGKNESYVTFDPFMDYAGELKPIFLFIHQFNEFNSSDEGWDADTNDDIEPADQWGNRALRVVGEQIRRYRRKIRREDSSEANDILGTASWTQGFSIVGFIAHQ
jgi:hypothetical protein